MKCIVNLFSDVGAKAKKLAVDTMQYGFEEVALARILAVEQVEQLEEKLLIYIFFGYIWLKVGRFQEAKKKLIDDLQVRPGGLQIRLVLLGIELGARRIRAGRQRAKHVNGEHFNDLVVDGLGDHAPICRYVLDHLVQRLPLHLLELEVAERIGGEVEYRAALLYLLDEQLLPVVGIGVLKRGQLLEFTIFADVKAGRALLFARIFFDERRGGRHLNFG